MEQAAPLTSHVRAKFYKIDSGREEWLDYRRIAGILKGAGYNGTVGVVFEGQGRQQLRRPGGDPPRRCPPSRHDRAAVIREILGVRLFGYGVPYRARVRGGVVEPLETGPETEAADLAQALARQRGAPGTGERDDAWAVSMPFGRCGLNGLPREHLLVFAAREAWLDLLTWEGPRVVAVKPGQPVAIEPQSVVRLRARPQPGGRVLVAFQTQDRTPLMGNAAPFTLDGEVPEGWDVRLRKGHEAFTEAAGLWDGDRPAYEAALERFFGSMAEKLEGDAAVAAVCEEARGAGSYDAADERVFFDYQEGMIDEPLLARIRAQDPELFRFPGMFGGITTLFNCLE